MPLNNQEWKCAEVVLIRGVITTNVPLYVLNFEMWSVIMNIRIVCAKTSFCLWWSRLKRMQRINDRWDVEETMLDWGNNDNDDDRWRTWDGTEREREIVVLAQCPNKKSRLRSSGISTSTSRLSHLPSPNPLIPDLFCGVGTQTSSTRRSFLRERQGRG